MMKKNGDQKPKKGKQKARKNGNPGGNLLQYNHHSGKSLEICVQKFKKKTEEIRERITQHTYFTVQLNNKDHSFS